MKKAKVKKESNFNLIGGSMKPFTERLLQVGVILVIVYVGWNLAVNTVVSMVNKNVVNARLTQELNQCKASLSDIVKSDKK